MIDRRIVRKLSLLALIAALATASQIAIARPVVVACPLWEASPYRAGDAASAMREYYEAGYVKAHPECEGLAMTCSPRLVRSWSGIRRLI